MLNFFGFVCFFLDSKKFKKRGGPSFVDTYLAQFELSVFKVNGRQHAVALVFSYWVVEHLVRLQTH